MEECSEEVAKFHDIFVKMERQRISGIHDKGVVETTSNAYKEQTMKPLNFVEVWEVLESPEVL